MALNSQKDSRASWSNVALNAVPPAASRGAAASSVVRMASLGGDRAEQPMAKARREPLNVRNWQMNRVANLIVNDVPGSNVHLTANTMAG